MRRRDDYYDRRRDDYYDRRRDDRYDRRRDDYDRREERRFLENGYGNKRVRHVSGRGRGYDGYDGELGTLPVVRGRNSDETYIYESTPVFNDYVEL